MGKHASKRQSHFQCIPLPAPAHLPHHDLSLLSQREKHCPLPVRTQLQTGTSSARFQNHRLHLQQHLTTVFCSGAELCPKSYFLPRYPRAVKRPGLPKCSTLCAPAGILDPSSTRDKTCQRAQKESTVTTNSSYAVLQSYSHPAFSAVASQGAKTDNPWIRPSPRQHATALAAEGVLPPTSLHLFPPQHLLPRTTLLCPYSATEFNPFHCHWLLESVVKVSTAGFEHSRGRDLQPAAGFWVASGSKRLLRPGLVVRTR